MTDPEQLGFEFTPTTPEEPRFSVEYLTIAEAAVRVRCCGRTLLRANDPPRDRERRAASRRRA